ncbi:MAG: transketolase [Lachnospiraceae bacterium]|nr:transketolase [Lachnospiraceae bacterium]
MDKEKFMKYGLQVKKIMFELMKNGKSGHIGGSLSVIDILIYVNQKMISEINSNLIYSKGHCEVALYAIYIKNRIISYSELHKLKCFGSKLQGHPCSKQIKEIDYSAGSLGQGLSFGLGLAIAKQERGEKVYCILGDGELQEGQVWEACLMAPRLKLDNLYVIVDCNGFQLEGITLSTGIVSRMKAVWELLGWDSQIIENGHDFEMIDKAFKNAAEKTKPHVLFAKTVKGNGISFMENNCEFHGKSMNDKEIKKALDELLGGNNASTKRFFYE